MTGKKPLTHLNDQGEAYIVDVGGKAETRRRAVAGAFVQASEETISAIIDNALGKGDALAVARMAGIMAAKKTAELIPLCHSIALTHAEVTFVQSGPTAIAVEASAETVGKTGVEMEAMTAASIAALTLYDMAKSLDRSMQVTAVRLLEKSGGKSGHYVRPGDDQS